MMDRPKKILIIRTDRMGDVILSTPIIKNLRIAFPDSFIAFMCRPYTKDIVDANPYLNEVIVYDKFGKHKSVVSSMKFAFNLRRKKFDWAMVLHPTNRVHLIAFFAGIPVRVGWDKKMGFLLTKRLPHLKQEGKRHELEYTLDLLQELNVPIVDKSTFFPLKEESENFIEKLLEKEGVDREDLFIVIHPSASCPSKRWPQEYFIRLIDLLKKGFNPKIALITSYKERVFGELIAKKVNGLLDLRGKLTLSQLGSLIRRANLFISNDSGPVHVASALNTPVISIFGRVDEGLSPVRWGPIGDKAIHLHKNVGCDVCYAHNCTKSYLCLRELTPGEVFLAAKKYL